MTRYAPASWLTVPSHFGRRPDVETHPTADLFEQGLADAAMAQHQAALAVNDELVRRGVTVVTLASVLGENAEHLRRKLTGKATASLRDLATWRRVSQLDIKAAASALAEPSGGTTSSQPTVAPATTVQATQFPRPTASWPTNRVDSR